MGFCWTGLCASHSQIRLYLEAEEVIEKPCYLLYSLIPCGFKQIEPERHRGCQKSASVYHYPYLCGSEILAPNRQNSSLAELDTGKTKIWVSWKPEPLVFASFSTRKVFVSLKNIQK